MLRSIYNWKTISFSIADSVEINDDDEAIIHGHTEIKVVCIKDKGIGVKTVTNDMECILADIDSELEANGKGKLEDYYCIYEDSEGIWDGVKFERTQFKTFSIDFYSIGGISLNDAKEKLAGKIIINKNDQLGIN